MRQDSSSTSRLTLGDPRRSLSGSLWRPEFEHDACGVAFVADMTGTRSHALISQAMTVLLNLEHRGASGSEPDTGDGAGILMQMPHELFERLADESGFSLPEEGCYISGLVFLPRESEAEASVVEGIGKLAEDEGFVVIGWRDVPTDNSMLGKTARRAEPRIRQVFLAPAEHSSTLMEGASSNGDPKDPDSRLMLERRAFLLRKRIEHEVEGVYFPSLSSRTFVYKGMLTAPQLGKYYQDLSDPALVSALAIVHSRFSTNTFPSWSLAHPYRYMAHNGEINTLRGNRNWMRARESLLESELFPGGLKRAFPICTPELSDSASFDEVVELLYLGGRSLPHAILMMIPEAFENDQEMDEERRAFYRFHASLMEPWDGPAAIAFTDGTLIGAVLDRNGLRPARYWVSDDGIVVMASETGVLDIDPAKVVTKGRLQPGRMLLVDTAQGRMIRDDEIKSELAKAHPYAEWVRAGQISLEDLPPRYMLTPQHASVVNHQRLFGYTEEELRMVIMPMAKNGAEPIGSMGADTPLAVLSSKPRLLYDYFTQLFAQVTNPPLDAIREELVTSLQATIGPEGNLLSASPESCRQIIIPFPVIDNEDLAKLRYVNEHGETPGFKAYAIDGLFPVADGGDGLKKAIEEVRAKVSKAIDDGANIIILSDRNSSRELAPIPALLLTSAVHHHLIRERTRTKVGLVVETGEAREVHHVALLIGYGASAVNPYLAFETIDDLIARGALEGVNPRQARRNYIKAAGKGVLKVMSKMGISTVASYTGAQVFEAIGLSDELVDEYFTGTPSRLGGVGLDVIAKEVAMRHSLAYPARPNELVHRELGVGGDYQWRREGEYHLFNPLTIFKLQYGTRTGRYETYKEYSAAVNEQAKHLATLRGLMRLKRGVLPPVPIEEVEPVSSIVKRFATGAMSYGSISAEAHETMAVAMNRLGAKSNTGEGGEDAERFQVSPDGDLRRSAIKQVASGRFGVTSEYLVNADDLQIKISQGAKPGEGGQLPGHKVYPWIAKTRHSTPGVGLISPPPHHDIYSIEDIAQLIHDLKSANPRARVHVKLVAEIGVGTVAAGVAKAHADVVLISGHDGGTGAAPLTSIKHAGGPWELGLAETQQTLLANGLRDRIVVQVDGQLKTGRDVVIAALLGAEEYGFATAALAVLGCVMMRVCHLDTCPVGIATQNPVLRRRFSGKPEYLVNFFQFVAEEVREYLASLGLRSLDEAIGRVDLLDVNPAIEHWKASNLDLSPILAIPEVDPETPRRRVREQDHGLEKSLDTAIMDRCLPALEEGKPVEIEMPVRNVDRTVGTLLGYELTKRRGAVGLPEDTILIKLHGSAGQSLGAFLPPGITIKVWGDANDYLGKGLSGGKIVLLPPPSSPFPAEKNVIVGNVVLYGATGGKAFIRGLAGERFAVRNSGAVAVVEGVGDHGCEYMTGGTVVVIGPCGRNFGAGMSGGVAYVYDPEATFSNHLNKEMVALEPLDGEDERMLSSLLEEHLDQTGSVVAKAILDNFPSELSCFVKVMPKDYKRVLQAMRKAVEEGISVDEAVMAAAHG